MSHVAFVYPAFQDASAERNVLPTAGGLAGRGHEVDVVLFERWSGTMPEGTRPIALDDWQGVSRSRLARVAPSLLTRFPVAAPALLRRGAALRVRRLAGYFERERPDVVFANFPKAEYAAYFAARMASPAPPVVPVLHTAAPPGSTDAGRRRYVWRATDRMVAVSRGAAQMASAVLGVPEDNISVIYNPAGTVRNLDRLVKEAPDHPWFRDGGPPVVLGAGRLAREKDFGVLIEAFHRVQSEYPSRLVILGEGEQRNVLEGMVRARGLEDRVSLPGWAENPFAYMARAALFVLSSRYEGFGIVLAEAMACGCPAVSTDCPAGPAEILEDPGLLAPVGDPESLARTMLRQLSKRADKAALRARAARFSLERTVEGYERFLAGEPMRTADGARQGR